jgi:hypothetical protein
MSDTDSICVSSEPEVWRPIPGADGYEVSNYGNVRSALRGGNHLVKRSQEFRLPEVGKEYEYLGSFVRVTRVIPLEGGESEDAYVEFTTRFDEHSSCQAGELREKQRRT